MEENFDDTVEWKYTAFEQECVENLESLPDPDTEFETKKNQYDEKLWNHFQLTATSIAQIYKECLSSNVNLWNSFQHASTNLAAIYKECSEFPKKHNEHIRQAGIYKRNKDLLNWAKKKKSYIRREDLLAFLAGRNHSAPVHNHIFQKYSRNSRQARNPEEYSRFLSPTQQSKTNSIFLYNELSSPSLSPSIEANLTTFTQALARTNRRNSPRSDDEDLSEFINQEYQRHVVLGSDSRKRPSSMDVCMDSPTHNKRAKFH